MTIEDSKIEEIKIRQLTNQYLITQTDKLTVVRDLCGIQSQFMANAMHSLKIRCNNYDESTLSTDLVRNWTLRGTVHVFAREDLPLFIHCNGGNDYRKNEWQKASFWNQRDKWALTPKRQQYFSEIILASLEHQSRTRDELKEICRGHGMTTAEEDSMFDSWGGGIRELCERGFMNYVVQQKKAYCLSPDFQPLPEAEAKLEIARRYFPHIAPATIHDAMYFFHTTAAQVKQWLSMLPVTSTECAGKTYYYIENGNPCSYSIPKCLFLAGFDQLMLGYEKKESLYLKAENLRTVFNLAGIVMPALMLDGQIIGIWKKKNRKLFIELFHPVTNTEIADIKENAEILWNDLGTIEIN